MRSSGFPLEADLHTDLHVTDPGSLQEQGKMLNELSDTAEDTRLYCSDVGKPASSFDLIACRCCAKCWLLSACCCF